MSRSARPGSASAGRRSRAPKTEGLHLLRLAVKGQKTNPVAFIVSPLPQVIEQEPNDTPAQAQRVQDPLRHQRPHRHARDLDHFVFKAKKGKAIRFEVKARRFGTGLRSSLDSVLEVMTPGARCSQSNDDTFGKDAALVFSPPANGDYVVRLRDLNSKGGPTAVYYLEADWAVPDFSLRCDPDKAMIGPGAQRCLVRPGDARQRFRRASQDRGKGAASGSDGQCPDHPANDDAGPSRVDSRGQRRA